MCRRPLRAGGLSPRPRLSFRLAAGELVGEQLALWRELQRHRVDAIALAARRRPVGEDVALVSAAAGADDLGADHAVAGVADGAEVIFRKRSREARPARAALELRAAPEQRQPAQAAGIHPRSLLFEEDAAERSFGSVLEQH